MTAPAHPGPRRPLVQLVLLRLHARQTLRGAQDDEATTGEAKSICGTIDARQHGDRYSDRDELSVVFPLPRRRIARTRDECRAGGTAPLAGAPRRFSWGNSIRSRSGRGSRETSMFRSLLFLLPLIALLGEGQSASARLSIGAYTRLHPRLMTSPPMARRPMMRIVMPWRVRRWAGLR